ncbi:MAG: GNAT family N-acetyltransferase [Pirellulaceae bacterium]
MKKTEQFQFRFEAESADLTRVRSIVAATEFFTPAEVEIAIELVEERLAKGKASGYEFIFADSTSALAGYVCFGEIPCTVGSFDIYWIVVAPECQRVGLGRKLMQLTEDKVRRYHGRRIYIDTSGREQYQSTRDFYARCGYLPACELPDFYDLGDSKVIYSLTLK